MTDRRKAVAVNAGVSRAGLFRTVLFSTYDSVAIKWTVLWGVLSIT